jgi:flagellar protein FliS
MKYSQRQAAEYRTMRISGLVADASPARLVQIMYEQILADLATAQGAMRRIKNNLPLNEVMNKCTAMDKALRLIQQLDVSLDMEKGGSIAENLRNLYLYILNRMTQINVTNDAAGAAEVSRLVRTIKTGWDETVRLGH